MMGRCHGPGRDWELESGAADSVVTSQEGALDGGGCVGFPDMSKHFIFTHPGFIFR